MKCCLSYMSHLSRVLLSKGNNDIRYPSRMYLHIYVDYDQLFRPPCQLNGRLVCPHCQLIGGLIRYHQGYLVST
jgi:hypothetical protein